MHCHSCHKLNAADSIFCEYCGAPLERDKYLQKHIPWTLQIVRYLGYLYGWGIAAITIFYALAAIFLIIYFYITEHETIAFLSSPVGDMIIQMYLGAIEIQTGYTTGEIIAIAIGLYIVLPIIVISLCVWGFLSTSKRIKDRVPSAKVSGNIFYGIMFVASLIGTINTIVGGIDLETLMVGFLLILVSAIPLVLLYLPPSRTAFEAWKKD